MEWYLLLLLFFGTLFVLMMTGLPVAFGFMLINVLAIYLMWGGQIGLGQLTHSIFESVANFALLPIPMFVLMGELTYHSGIMFNALSAINKILGRMPGRLSLVAVLTGTLLAATTGVSMGTVALLGTSLLPDMRKLGYKNSMSLGPILGSGGLAIMIPPSNLAVLFAALGQISIGAVLMSIIVPGLILSVLYMLYIIIRCSLQPSLAPSYETAGLRASEKIMAFVQHVLPIGFIVFMVIGVIFVGIATPSEAAATGALGCLLLALASRGLNWEMLKKSFLGTLRLTVMIFMIITGAKAFGQALAFSGISSSLIDFVGSLGLSPVLLLIGMVVIMVFLGMFMECICMMMISIPLFMPLVHLAGINPIWFAGVLMLSITMAPISPPFGLDLFTMRGVAPPDITMGEIYKAAFPFLVLQALLIGLLIAFPTLVLWLPKMMIG